MSATSLRVHATAAARADRPRVRLLHTRYPHMGTHSGMPVLARALDPRDVDVRVQMVQDGDDEFPLRHPGVRARLRRRAQRAMPWYKLSDLAAELRALPGCLAGHTDVLHYLDGEHSAQLLPAVLRAAPLARARTVATFHQPPELLDDLVSRAVVARLDCVTVVAPSQAAWFRETLPAERVKVLPHGVDAAFFHPAPRHGTEEQPPRCVTVGHWLRDWTAVRAVATRLPDVEFHVVTGHDPGLDGLPNVRRHRGVSDVALRALYRSADVLFLPLEQSTANNALLEGMACGLPVVSTALDAVRAYAGDDTGALVPRGDADALAHALAERLADPARRRAEGARARARAEALAWPTVAARYARLYRRLWEGTGA